MLCHYETNISHITRTAKKCVLPRYEANNILQDQVVCEITQKCAPDATESIVLYVFVKAAVYMIIV